LFVDEAGQLRGAGRRLQFVYGIRELVDSESTEQNYYHNDGERSPINSLSQALFNFICNLERCQLLINKVGSHDFNNLTTQMLSG
jgi:hypothetical protein